MDKLFAILLLSFLFTGVLSIPFINLLYNLRFRLKVVKNQEKGTRVSQLHKGKVGTPTGGGILIIIATLIFSVMYYGVTSFSINWTSIVLFVTLILFGLIGFYDDLRKMFRMSSRKIYALPALHKLVLQFIFASLVGYLLYSQLHLTSLTIPFLGPLLGLDPIHLGVWYVVFAAFTIVASSNAYNITDGLDGLATGLLMIALTAFWVLANGSPFAGDVSVFIAVVMGTLLAFLYFNIYPARLFMGDTGSLALGAMLAVIALMLEQGLILPIIGGLFVVELFSSLVQILSKKYRKGKRILKIAPLHFHFQAVGWDETKVTMRFWLAGILFAFLGLFLATFGGW